MNWTVKMIIPCECREKMASPIVESEVLRRSKGLSPLVGFVDLDRDVLLSAEYAELFESNGFEAESVYQRMSLNRFEITKVFYPYGIVLEGSLEFENIDSIYNWTEEFHDYFSLRNVFSSEKGKPKWFMTSTPIFVFETDDMPTPKPKKADVSPIIDNNGYLLKEGNSSIIIEDPIVIIPNKDSVSKKVRDDLITALKTVCAMSSISRDIRFELKRLGESGKPKKMDSISLYQRLKSFLCQSQKEKKNNKNDGSDKYRRLLDLQKKCAIINELASSTIYGSCQQKRIYDIVKKYFHVEDMLLQTDRARIYIENMVEYEENKLSKQINETLFITGYVGLVLSIFGFFPLTIRNLIVIKQPITYSQRWIAVVCIMIASVGLCILLVQLFNGYKRCTERIRTILKKILELLAVALIAVGILYAYILAF